MDKAPPKKRNALSDAFNDIDEDKDTNIHGLDAKTESKDEIESYLKYPILSKKITKVTAIDRNFAVPEFITNATNAFEMIFEAFAKGDRDTLKMLLLPDTYDGFCAALDEREGLGHNCNDAILAIHNAQIIDINLTGNHAEITLLFDTEQINVTYDQDGQLIEGSADIPSKIEEYWTFSKNLKSRDPAWALVATHNGHDEG